MFGTHHHGAFDKWWEYAAKNYVTWDDGNPVGLDLYYDPIVDEHVAHGPMGIIAPTWYFAPQRREVAQAGWNTAAFVNGITGNGPVTGFDEPARATMLLQFAGEFADAETKARVWAAADEHIEPTWDRERGEFTLGFGLNEAHPRGQMNARAMAGWVCTPGAWAQIFNEPNLTKFDEPTVVDVDFPRVALSEARWDGAALHLAAHAQNEAAHGTQTNLNITNVASSDDWTMTDADGKTTPLGRDAGQVRVTLLVDNRAVIIRRN